MKKFKVLFDANIPNAYEAWPDKKQKKNLDELLKERIYVLFPSGEFISETLAMIGTSSEKLLRPRIEWILASIGGPLFLHWGEILLNELNGDKTVYVDEELQNHFIRHLELVGVDPSVENLLSLKQRITAEKLESKAFYKNLQDNIRNSVLTNKKELDFQEFHERYWERWKLETLIELYERLDASDPIASAKSAMVNIDNLPYTGAMMKIYSAMFYRFYIEDRSLKKEIDIYDAGQLVYMAGLDILVTEDSRLREVFNMTYQPPKLVLSFKELLEHVGSLTNC